MSNKSVLLGSMFAVLSTIALTCMSVLVKLIGTDIPITEIIWVRFIIGLLVITPFVISLKVDLHLKHPLKFLLRSLYALIGMGLLFFSVQHLPLSTAILLSNMTPIFVPILAFLITKAKVTRLGSVGIIVGFIGIGIVLDPSHSGVSWESLIAIASSFFTALAILQIRLLGKSMQTYPMLFYYFLMSTLLMTPFVLIERTLPHSPETLIFLLLVGVSGLIYQIFSTLSYKLAPVRITTPILYLNVVLGVLAEWLLWGQKPTLQFLAGGIIVVIGVVITVLYGIPKELKK